MKNIGLAALLVQLAVTDKERGRSFLPFFPPFFFPQAHLLFSQSNMSATRKKGLEMSRLPKIRHHITLDQIPISTLVSTLIVS